AALGAGLDPDAPAVAPDDLLDDGQADAGAGIRVAGVQALEHLEDALAVARVDADAVVGDLEVPVLALAARADLDARGGLAAELQRVGDEVLEQLGELHPVAVDGGQIGGEHLPARLGDLLAQALEHLAQQLADVDRAPLLDAPDARVGEQAVEQRAHSLRRARQRGEQALGRLVEVARVARLEQLGDAAHDAQRLAQVVRDDRRELGELLVGALELSGAVLGFDAGLVRLGEVEALDDDVVDVPVLAGDRGPAPADQAPAVGRLVPRQRALLAALGLRHGEGAVHLGQLLGG